MTASPPANVESMTSSTETTVAPEGEEAATSTSNTSATGRCALEGDSVTLDQLGEDGTEVEFLVDVSVTASGSAPLRNSRRITIRSEAVVDGEWQLTMTDLVGERVANYADRLPVINPVDDRFRVEVAYTVGPDGTVALAGEDTGSAINAAYAGFIFDAFGPTNGELGEDPAFGADWSDIVAAGGLELLDPSSAADRTLSMLAMIHAHHGETFMLDQSSSFAGEWREVGLAGPVRFPEIVVEASIGRDGCLVVESNASATADKSTATRTVKRDPATGYIRGIYSSVRLAVAESEIGFSTSINAVE